MEFLTHKSRTVTPQTRFLGSVPKRRRKAQFPRKGRPDLERGPRPRKYTSSYWVVRYRSFLPTKSERSCPRLGFLIPSKNAEERHNGLERDDRTWNGVRGLESPHLATGWSDLEVSCPQKPNDDAPDSVSWVRPKTTKKGTMA